MTGLAPHILIVDDNPGDVCFISEQLSDVFGGGLTVTAADTLEQGLHFSRTQDFEIVILDLNLPDSQGLETLRLWRSEHPRIPVLAVSGELSDPLRMELLEAGAHEILCKQDLSGRLFALSVLYMIERNRADYQRYQLEKILNLSPDAVLVVTREGRLQYHNKAARTLFGRSEEELEEETLLFSGQEGVPVELRILRGDSERLGEMRLVNLHWKGKPSVLASIRDVTEQKKMEMQLLLSDRLASLGTVAAGVAHEINNPLVSVVGNLELAQEQVEELAQGLALPASLGELLQDAREAAEQVRQIVRDLKIFSSPEEDLLVPVDVQKVIESSLRMSWHEIRNRAKLVKDYASTKLPPALANDSRLGQVVLNLLVNAAQSFGDTPSSQNVVKVSTGLDGRGRVAISISDNGCGISEQVQKQLFTPFFTTKPVGMGTGLGLAISHRIVASFGGELSLQSSPGEGTCFTVSLPAAPVDPTTQEPILVELARLVNPRMLVVDDQTHIGLLFQKVFESAHEVTYLPQARLAMEKIRDGARYDIIFCDLTMPEMSGSDFYAALQELNVGLERRLVFMSGGAVTADMRQFFATVPNPRLDKPFNIQRLRSFVQGYFANLNV